MKMSLSYRYEHLFILTQQDFPIRSIAYIKKYLHNYIHCSFIKCSLVSKNTPKFDKITKPYFYMNAIIRNPNVHLIDKITTYLSPFYLLEKIHHIKNYKKETHKYTVSYPESKFIIHDPFDLLENSTPYHNITYGPSICLAKKHVEYLIKNSASRKLARALKWHFAPEEYFIQTILKDSDLPSTELLNKQLCITNYDMSKSLNIKTYKGYLNLITSVDIIFLRKIEDLAVMDLLDEYRKNT